MSLKLEQITFKRGGFELQLNAELQQRVTGIFGPSGSGKSTLLEIIAGLLTPTSGRIVHNSDVLEDASTQTHLPPHRRKIGFVFQDSRLFPHMNVRRNLMFGCKTPKSQITRMTFDRIVGLLEIDQLLDRQPDTLSGGEEKRVAIGRALMAEPSMLLLDEPLTGLDTRLQRQILPLLRQVRDEIKIPMLFVSHDLSQLLSITSDLMLLSQGKLVASGNIADLCFDESALNMLLPSGLSNVFEGEVLEHRVDAGCSVVRISEQQTLQIPLSEVEAGNNVILTIRPQDIALSNTHVEGVSIRNQLQATVRRTVSVGHQMLVELMCPLPLIAEVSRGSFERLGLAKGKSVSCLIKSNAIDSVRA